MEPISLIKVSDDISVHICPICINLTIEPVETECKHTFCFTCLEDLMENSASEDQFKCPMCRTVMSKNFDMKVNKILDRQLKVKFKKDYEARQKLLDEYRKSQEGIVKIKILYGNTHELVPSLVNSDSSESSNKHKWGAFVKVVGESSDKFISKVNFKLHPTFNPNEVSVNKPPFQISRIGWGTFDVPMTIYWKSNYNTKPVELSHTLSFTDKGETKVYIFKYIP